MACVDVNGIVIEEKAMLPVASGQCGLRQSNSVFLHIRNLEILTQSMFSTLGEHHIRSVSVSVKPTDSSDSYMPVFLAGLSSATAMACALRVPIVRTSHQRGHVRAALKGNEELLSVKSFSALHLSGGTTDLLRVQTQNNCLSQLTCVGGSDDLHIGQFVDRIGVRLGLSFPAGSALEGLALQAVLRNIKITASVKGAYCSFSGPESQAQRLIDDNVDAAEIAYAVYDCMARTVGGIIRDETGSVLLCGGVAGSMLFRKLLSNYTRAKLYFSDPKLSGDNAVGVALLGMDEWEKIN